MRWDLTTIEEECHTPNQQEEKRRWNRPMDFLICLQIIDTILINTSTNIAKNDINAKIGELELKH